MVELTQVSAKIADYKCFGNEAHGFDQILPINLIIGRNNSGKSALLDLIDYLASPKDLALLGHQGKKPQVILSAVLQELELQQVFRKDARGGGIRAANDWEYGRQWLGKTFSWTVSANGRTAYHSVNPPFDPEVQNYAENL